MWLCVTSLLFCAPALTAYIANDFVLMNAMLILVGTSVVNHAKLRNPLISRLALFFDRSYSRILTGLCISISIWNMQSCSHAVM